MDNQKNKLDLTELKFENEYYLWFKCSTSIPVNETKQWEHGEILDFKDNLDEINSNEYLLYFSLSNGEIFATRLSIRPNEEDKQDFENALKRKNYYLTLFESISSDGNEICLRFCFFMGEIIKTSSNIEFALSNKVLKDFNSYKKENLRNLNLITEYINNNYSFDYHGSSHFIIDRVSDRELEDLNNEENKKELDAFSLIGNNSKLIVKVLYYGNNKIYSVIGWKKNISKHYTFSTASLISGNFVFKREFDTIKEIQDEIIAKRYSDKDSYFKNWTVYIDGLMNLWLERAKLCGCYKIVGSEIIEKSKKKYKVYLDKQINEDFITFCQQENGPRAWICKNLPKFFSEEITGREYLESLLIRKEEDDDGNYYIKDEEDITISNENDDYDEVEDDEDDENENSGVNNLKETISNKNDAEKSSLENKREKKKPLNKYAPSLNFEKNDILDVSIALTEKSDQLEVILDITNNKPPSGYICISLTGNLTNIKRCLKAKEDIRLGFCANPQLRAIIEDTGVFTDFAKSNRKEISALSPYILEKVFKNNPPTPAQEEAIKLALNTPDILLIQGPPGTGKTTVITAIVERLNEIHNSQKSRKGEVLVSAYQHAAVENIIDRLSVNDLPASNLSNKRNVEDSNEVRKYIDREKLDNWIIERKEQLEKKYKDVLESNYQEILETTKLNYLSLPSAYSACNLLREIINIPTDNYLLDAQNRAKILMERYSISNESDENLEENLSEFIPLVRSIRTSEIAFKDDGPDRAYDLLHSKISNYIDDDFKELLEKASDWFGEGDLSFLNDLKKEKEKFIDRLVPVNEGLSEDLDDELLNLCSEVESILKKNNPNIKQNTLQSVIYELYNDYVTNPGLIYNDLNEYTYSFAATTQQSVGFNIREAKSNGLDRIKFKTVIVDEAARANPPDLLIPMALGEERIILVGDHKQLPQIIEDSVLDINEKESQNPDSKVEKIDEEIIKSSLFEYLHTRLAKLTDFKRIIMLDKQYRMHPLLGNFVSKWFYEIDNGQGFESPLKPEQCQHNLKDIDIQGIDYIKNLENYAAVWYDIRNEKNRFRNRSRYRTKEADCIAKKLKAWMDSEAGKKLSFGIITFFKEQEKEIRNSLINIGIMSKKNGLFEINNEYKFLVKKKLVENREIEVSDERLQVGTVDAFQGKEFDVVILSLVVSPNLEQKDIIIPKEDMIKAKKIFSRICTSEKVGAAKNLLCVATSRQKKLLAIFGDKALFKSNAAAEHSKELHELLRICEKENNGKYEKL